MLPVMAGSIDLPVGVGVSETSPLVICPAGGSTVGEPVKLRSNSRRANANSVHSAAVGPGVPGAVLAANGLRAALTTLGTISATWYTALMIDTIGGVVAGGRLHGDGNDAAGVDTVGGSCGVGGGCFRVRPRCGSPSQPGSPAAPTLWWSRRGQRRNGDCRPSAGLTLGPPTSFGRSGRAGERLERRRSLFAGALEFVRSRPDRPGIVARELAGSRRGERCRRTARNRSLNLVCAPPVPTSRTKSPAERVADCADPGGVVDADIDVPWSIGDLVDFCGGPDADGAGAATCPTPPRSPEVAAPVDDESRDELVLEPAGSATATAGVLAIAVPTPSATAMPRRDRCT